MFDKLQIIFWSFTYVLIAVAGFQSRKIKKISIPYSACICNFCWELCALISSKGFWGHICWFALDCIIVFWGAMFLCAKKRRIYISLIILGSFVFWCIFRLERGMLFSSFVIDLSMALSFLWNRKKMSSKLKIMIAFTKLIGDTFAGLYYYKESIIILVIAVMVFYVNILYLIMCIKEKYILRK